MLQRFVDNVLAVTKESVKTFTYESLNNIARLINGVSALLLAVLPGKTKILEGIQGWELRPTFRGPRLPRWMENGVSSFNEFIHELSMDSDTSSSDEYLSGEEDIDDDMLPPSPMSYSSRISRASSFRRYDRSVFRVIKYLFSWIVWTITLFLCIPIAICRVIGIRKHASSSDNSSSSEQLLNPNSRKTPHVKDHIFTRTTDRRRGVVEDLHLAIEIFIEAVFEMVHNAAHFMLSPSAIFSKIFGSASNNRASVKKDDYESDDEVPVPTATLGNADPAPTERQIRFHHSLNIDARTCRDVITELGYPYEAIRVVTSDGYVLLLERIPRHDSQKVVYLQHGILDSSMGWISNGVVGSPAFAAYDQGYDVYLGNLRGLVSREHVDKNISSRKYWRYSINEHGTQDVPAMIEKIHEIKISELRKINQPASEEEEQTQPYKLCVICHSLGGAVMLMYLITQKLAQKPHRVSRMILLSPAGFHEDSGLLFTVVEHLVLIIGPLLTPFIHGLYIPTQFFRMLLNKLARDFQNYPALGGLVQTLMSYVVGGDSSNWIGVLGLPHYNMYDMPGVSLHVAIHLAQIKRAKRFIMYDYGNANANIEAYGMPKPLDLGEHYNLIDIPIDLVAGRKDKVIRPTMVRKHYRLMKRAGVDVSYNEFEYAHLDFTFSHREELLSYVMSRLLLVEPPQKHVGVRHRKHIRIAHKHDTDEIKPLEKE